MSRPTHVHHLAWALAFLCAAIAVSPVSADVVRMRSGDVLTGTVDHASFVLTAAEGRLEIPRNSVSVIETTAAGVRLTLVDGREIEGTLDRSTISLKKDLLSRLLELSAIERIELADPAASIGEGVEIPLILGGLPPTMPTSRRVILCAEGEVSKEGIPIVEARAPALARVLSVEETQAKEGIQVPIRLERILTSSGELLPLEPDTQLRVAFNADSVYSGLLARGKYVAPEPGLPLLGRIASTSADDATQLGSAFWESARQACIRGFDLRGQRGFLPSPWIYSNLTYYPVPQPLQIAIPFHSLLDQHFQTEAFPTLRVNGTAISRLRMSLQPRRRGGMRLILRTELHTDAEHDRAADLEFRVMAGDTVLGSEREKGIDAEEGKRKNFKEKIDLSESSMQKLHASDDPRLLVSMSVRRD